GAGPLRQPRRGPLPPALPQDRPGPRPAAALRPPAPREDRPRPGREPAPPGFPDNRPPAGAARLFPGCLTPADAADFPMQDGLPIRPGNAVDTRPAGWDRGASGCALIPRANGRAGDGPPGGGPVPVPGQRPRAG